MPPIETVSDYRTDIHKNKHANSITMNKPPIDQYNFTILLFYVGRSESKERIAIQRYLLITGKKQNMQVLSHTFTYFST